MTSLKHALNLNVKETLNIRGYSRQMNTLASRVAEAVSVAKQNGHTVADIAKACNITVQSVYQWVDGSTKSIDGANLVELAELSGLSARWIAKGTGGKIGVYVTNQKVMNAVRAMEALPEYGQDQLAKSVVEFAELITKAGQPRPNGTDG